MKRLLLCVSVPAFLFFTGLLSGCGTSINAAPDAAGGSAITGTIFGGQQPMVGARVYLLAVGTGGYGSASFSMLNPGSTNNATDSIGSYVVTDANGKFTVSGDYTCGTGYALGSSAAVTLSGQQQIYLYSLGGYGGQGGQGINASAGMLTALGNCAAPITTVTINEVTTVAMAYAFAGFAQDATHIGGSNTSLARVNLVNAFQNAVNLVNATTGVPQTSTAATTLPVANIYTLADILAACVNSNGTTGGSCNTLFTYAKSSGATGTKPSDTATAAINLAKNPYPTAAGMTALYGLVPASGAPYVGGLNAQPNDFTLAIAHNITTGGFPGLNNVQVAVDAAGDAWASYNSGLLEITPSGAISNLTPSGLNQPSSIAFDLSGFIWVPNEGAAAINELTSAGANVGGSPFSPTGLSTAYNVAVSKTGSIFVVNAGPNYTDGTTINKLNPTGTNAAGSPFSPNGILGPDALAFDGNGVLWVTNIGNSVVATVSATTGVTSNTYPGPGSPTTIAFDSANNAWIAASTGLTKIPNSGPAANGSPYTTGNATMTPVSAAVDSSGNVWVTDQAINAIDEFSNTGTLLSPTTGYTGGLAFPAASVQGLAIDGDGDVWITSLGGSAVYEFIGLAKPVVTPLVANLAGSYTTPASLP